MSTKQLMIRATVLFPITDYLDEAAVRHARRQWVRSIAVLRCRAAGSRWILDQRIGRQ